MAQSTPLPFLIIQKAFPFLEKVAPKIAGRLGYYLFFRPMNTPLKEEEKALLKSAGQFKLNIDTRAMIGYSWGNESSNKTAVFMHGWAGKAAQPYALINALAAEGYKVFAFDGPGHGASEGTRTHVFEFVEVMQQLQEKIGDIDVLIGHSFGSIASCNALKDGLRVKKYVSLSAPTIASDILKEFSKIVNCTRTTTKIMEDLVFEEISQEFHTVSIEYIAPQIPKVPMLIMHDKDDKRVGLFNSERMHDLLPHSEFVSTAGLGHNRIMNDEQVIERVLEFAKITRA